MRGEGNQRYPESGTLRRSWGEKTSWVEMEDRERSQMDRGVIFEMISGGPALG